MGQSEDFDTSIIESKIGCHILDPMAVRKEKNAQTWFLPVWIAQVLEAVPQEFLLLLCSHCKTRVMGLSRCCHKQEVSGRIVCLCCGSRPRTSVSS